jgi:hypothetical protein
MKNEKSAYKADGRSDDHSKNATKKTDASKGGSGNNSNQQGHSSKKESGKMSKDAQQAKDKK